MTMTDEQEVLDCEDLPSDPETLVPEEFLPSEPSMTSLMFEHVDLSKAATYATAEVAKFFFLRSAAWLRWKQGEGAFENPVTGEVVQPERDRRNARRYTLLDIERLVHAMYANGSIQESQLHVAKHVLWWTGVGSGIPFVVPEIEEIEEIVPMVEVEEVEPIHFVVPDVE